MEEELRGWEKRTWLALKTKYFEETWFLFQGVECRRWVGKEGVLWKQKWRGKKQKPSRIILDEWESFCEHLASQLSTAHQQVKPLAHWSGIYNGWETVKNLEHARVKAGAWRMRPRASRYMGHTQEWVQLLCFVLSPLIRKTVLMKVCEFPENAWGCRMLALLTD